MGINRKYAWSYILKGQFNQLILLLNNPDMLMCNLSVLWAKIKLDLQEKIKKWYFNIHKKTKLLSWLNVGDISCYLGEMTI